MDRRGFSLVELLWVIIIIGILAAVAIPLMQGRTDAARWSEGRAAMGTIATQLRCYAVRNGTNGTYPPSLAELGFLDSDLEGAYFDIDDYSIIEAAFTLGANPELTYTIQCDKPTLTPGRRTLNHAGVWTEENP